MARIAVFNVKYSPNLGDGIIAECLEAEIERQRRGWKAESIDLAGREDYGTGLDAARGRVLKLLDAMPTFMRSFALYILLSGLVRFRLRPSWRAQLAKADAVIVGGGQLIGDADLNFPIKLHGALRDVRERRLPFAVFGVGVAKDLTRTARRLFARVFAGENLVHVAVRDEASASHWEHHFARQKIRLAKKCRDPGLLAGELYRKNEFAEPRKRPLVGLGIVNPRTLDRHSGADNNVQVERALSHSSQLAIDLIHAGFDVSLFTNGPQDDEDFLDLVLQRAGDPHIRRSPRPCLPRELAGIIQSFDAVVAHRLHANILAYAFRIPHVGLSWNPKVQAFFNSVDRGQFVADLAECRPGSICDLVARAYRDGIDRSSHAMVVSETKEAVRTCLDNLAEQLGDGDSAGDEKLEFENSVRA